MDIAKLDIVKLSNEGFPCVIVNPKTDDDTDMVIVIRGIYADNFRDESERADTVEKTVDLLAKFTISWENVEENGKTLKFTPENVKRVYRDFPVIRGQVLSAAMDVRNFIRD